MEHVRTKQTVWEIMKHGMQLGKEFFLFEEDGCSSSQLRPLDQLPWAVQAEMETLVKSGDFVVVFVFFVFSLPS